MKKVEVHVKNNHRDYRSGANEVDFKRAGRNSGRKGLSNALSHELEFFCDFEQLIRIDNRDG